MRLLDTKTLRFEEFFEKQVPAYAILSHRWEKEEITFRDMSSPSSRLRAQSKYGFAKLRNACVLALSQGYNYLWIDTCCIDKTSSAELTEAINSMYNWYKAANVCYAFLSDVYAREDITTSRWFTRGWTLQELIAPRLLAFYSGDWEPLGTKKEHAISISRSTGIDVHVLLGGDPTEISVARRMFWAAERQTTRIEDEAYCLLGLFDVNMPLIYGEGSKAFRRLQEEIIRRSDDHSIFAWYATAAPRGGPVNILAPSAKAFLESGDVSPHPFHRVGQKPMMITNQGVSLDLLLMSAGLSHQENDDKEDYFAEVEAILDCQIGSVPGTFPTIRLKRVNAKQTAGESHYYRIITAGRTEFAYFDHRALLNDSAVLGFDPTHLEHPVYKEALDRNNLRWEKRRITITHRLPAPDLAVKAWSLSLLAAQDPPENTNFWIVSFRAHDFHARVVDVFPPERWDRHSSQFRGVPVPRKYHDQDRFRVVDGVFGLGFIGRFNGEPFTEHQPPGSGLRSDVCLLLGRQADSRRESPAPWCRLVFDGDKRDLARLYSVWESTSDFGTGNQVKYTREPSEHSLDLGEAYGLKASVSGKEISGVMYYVVRLEPSRIGWPNRGFFLVRNHGP